MQLQNVNNCVAEAGCGSAGITKLGGLLGAADLQTRGANPGVDGWQLMCVHAEGLTEERLTDIPEHLRCFAVPAGRVMPLGRMHQPEHFERWLRDIGWRVCISRTHAQLEATPGGLRVTNVSANPIYVNREPLLKGASRMLQHGELVSFAKPEGDTFVHFLVFQLRPGAPAAEANTSTTTPAGPALHVGAGSTSVAPNGATESPTAFAETLAMRLGQNLFSSENLRCLRRVR